MTTTIKDVLIAEFKAKEKRTCMVATIRGEGFKAINNILELCGMNNRECCSRGISNIVDIIQKECVSLLDTFYEIRTDE